MRIYIEYVILNNLSVNTMILYLVGVILHADMRWYRIFVSAIIGTIYAILLPYISFNADIFVKIILSFIMIIVAFRVHSVREYMMRLLAFYLVTFLFGGVVIGMGYMLGSDLFNLLLYPSSLIATYMSLIIFGITMVTRVLIVHIEHYMRKRKYYYDVTIRAGDNVTSAVGYLDSGNLLYNGITKVIIVDERLLKELTLNTPLADECISVDTISGTRHEYMYKIDSIDISQNGIHKNYKNIYGIKSNRHFSDFDVLLHGEM